MENVSYISPSATAKNATTTRKGWKLLDDKDYDRLNKLLRDMIRYLEESTSQMFSQSPPKIKQSLTLEDVIDFIDTASLRELQILSERLRKALELKKKIAKSR
jgi:uncharacterized protein YcbX